MQTLTYFLNGLLSIGVPLCLAIILIRKYDLEWRLFWIGAGTFILSQIAHLPFNYLIQPLFDRPILARLPYSGQLLFTAVFLGLSAGLFEELSRYAMYRWWARDARSWAKGVLVGAGHGGVEAIIVGLVSLYFFIVFLVLRGNLTLLPPEDLPLAQAQVNAYWSAPWYMTLLPAVERLFTIAAHLAMSLMVMQSLTRKHFGWVWAAVGFHALLDGVSVYSLQMGVPVLAVEGIIGIFALVSLAIIFLLRKVEPIPASVPAAEKSKSALIKPVEETPDNLDATRFK